MALGVKMVTVELVLISDLSFSCRVFLGCEISLASLTHHTPIRTTIRRFDVDVF